MYLALVHGQTPANTVTDALAEGDEQAGLLDQGSFRVQPTLWQKVQALAREVLGMQPAEWEHQP